MLVNATYFHGYWQTQFDPRVTRQQDFETFSGLTTKVPMMAVSGEFAHSYSPEFQAVVLPYKGGRFSMLVVLPSRRLTAGAFAKWFTPDVWARAQASMETTEIDVQLPRFTIDSTLDLIPPLKAMGMEPAFAPGADFTAICGGCGISQIRQVAHIEVDEQGTTAAAATGVAMGSAAHLPIAVNRPFAFGLIDNATGSPLFLGVVGKP